MPDTTVHVSFIVRDEAKLEDQLKAVFEHDENIVGMRSGADPEQRSSLKLFAKAMEDKLKKNDHKTAWRSLPIEALFRQMLLEVEEFKVAREFLTVKEARLELVDVANFALIVWDRLSLEKQEAKVE